MRRLVTVSAPLLGILLAQAGCGDSVGLDEESFDLRSVSPSADADGVSVLSSVTVRFSSEVDSASLTDGIGLESGGRSVIVDLSISDDRTVVMTPANPMDFGSEYRVLLRPTLVSRSGISFDSAVSWTFTTRGRPPPSPSLDSLRRHLGALAHDSMRGRLSGSVDELRAARYLEGRFLAYGLRAPSGGVIQPFDAISRRGDTLLSSRNVLAEIRGSGGLAEDWLVVGAHYDHIGYRGLVDETQGPNNGADDNASGAALAGIPWLGFFTDLHDDYHSPGDDVELINFAGLGRIEALAFRILTRLLVMPEPPPFIGPIPDLPAASESVASTPSRDRQPMSSRFLLSLALPGLGD